MVYFVRGAVLLVCLSGLAYGGMPHDEAKLEKAFETCSQATPVTKEWLTNLYSEFAVGKVSMEPEKAAKCYFSCFIGEMDMWNSDGTIKPGAGNGQFEECVEKMNNQAMPDRCERAYQFHKCIHMQNPNLPVY